MADISQYLANILSAVYGEDVRGSIHDAIEIINDVGEAVLTTGSGAPSGTTFENSLYIDTTNWIVYKYTSGAWVSQGTIRGTDGVGITSITKSATAGLVDTYTILYTDGTSTTFTVTNGADGDDGNKWYRGTAISGKAVNPTVYSSSGITLANPNDFYLNITEGAIYYCVSGGDASTATWSYDFTMSGGGSNPEWVDVQNKPFSSIGSTLKVATDTLDVDQDNLSYDASPTSASTKLVKSGGIYTALQNVSGTVSDAWDSGTTYAVGDYCIYNNTLWKCLTANTATTPTEGSDWTAKTVGEELGSLNSELTDLNSDIVAQFGSLTALDYYYGAGGTVEVPIILPSYNNTMLIVSGSRMASFMINESGNITSPTSTDITVTYSDGKLKITGSTWYTRSIILCSWKSK